MEVKNVKRIVCKVTDSKIWYFEDFLIKLTKNLAKGHNVLIDFIGEGPCCESLGLNKIINQILSSVGGSKESISIITSNLIESSGFREIRRDTFTELRDLSFMYTNSVNSPENFTQHFGMFVSRCNWKRLAMANYLWSKYKQQSVMTFHYDPQNDYHKDNFGLERFLQFDWANTSIMDFLQQLPMKFENVRYPIVYQEPYDLNPMYENFFCDIVCETYFTGQVFTVTEKTIRSIINKKPFIVQGPQWYLKNLKSLGFNTFDRWWSEGYDEDSDNGNLTSIFQSIDHIARQKLSTLKRWYEEMQPVLDNNYRVLNSINRNQLHSTKFTSPQ